MGMWTMLLAFRLNVFCPIVSDSRWSRFVKLDRLCTVALGAAAEEEDEWGAEKSTDLLGIAASSLRSARSTRTVDSESDADAEAANELRADCVSGDGGRGYLEEAELELSSLEGWVA